MTPLAPGDPQPVFRLRRGHGGMGLFLGGMIAVLAGMALPGVAPRETQGTLFLALFAMPVVGWLVGRWLVYDVCSRPGCRTALSADRETCPSCRGAIGGIVSTAAAHYAAAADVRRDLAARRASDRRKSKAKPRGKKARGEAS